MYVGWSNHIKSFVRKIEIYAERKTVGDIVKLKMVTKIGGGAATETYSSNTACVERKWKSNTKEKMKLKGKSWVDRVKRYKESRLDLEKKEEESGYIKQ